MHSILHKKKLLLIVTISILLIIVFTLRTDNSQLPYGQYKIDKCLHVSLLSSSGDIDATRERKVIVSIEEDLFQITSPNANIKIHNAIYKKEKMNYAMIREFKNNGMPVYKYRNKHIYSISGANSNVNSKYYLFTLDDELWVAFCTHSSENFNMSFVYYMYELKKFN